PDHLHGRRTPKNLSNTGTFDAALDGNPTVNPTTLVVIIKVEDRIGNQVPPQVPPIPTGVGVDIGYIRSVIQMLTTLVEAQHQHVGLGTIYAVGGGGLKNFLRLKLKSMV
ncbi:hypothetical protein HAX54_011063, partial [Datura stramonium]|nr:hypothetical protein [Datura stramonium]